MPICRCVPLSTSLGRGRGRAWWRWRDSNPRPLGYEPSELPTALHRYDPTDHEVVGCRAIQLCPSGSAARRQVASHGALLGFRSPRVLRGRGGDLNLDGGSMRGWVYQGVGCAWGTVLVGGGLCAPSPGAHNRRGAALCNRAGWLRWGLKENNPRRWPGVSFQYLGCTIARARSSVTLGLGRFKFGANGRVTAPNSGHSQDGQRTEPRAPAESGHRRTDLRAHRERPRPTLHPPERPGHSHQQHVR